ncbi:hypothetical protein DNO_0268 [Dichelobacter nodosus VCS1703A]|uniref:Uncharacterized protein n=1 Tax=Dichelobacter nodosus (strain VCS1703A) TaxID=246195 RepID=A5EWA6_DICNV|nr:hypothetical protein DNO_0268 [Dichelobacter nodosus VCS1703A]
MSRSALDRAVIIASAPCFDTINKVFNALGLVFSVCCQKQEKET